MKRTAEEDVEEKNPVERQKSAPKTRPWKKRTLKVASGVVLWWQSRVEYLYYVAVQPWPKAQMQNLKYHWRIVGVAKHKPKPHKPVPPNSNSAKRGKPFGQATRLTLAA
ncbi:hypothetical protein DFH07DRAFT_763656 [Mycena maculata]|uniref:Uncharacterized protein n=1 Tax=Mycena maculata TaxID=230809 RepID=A0AAD7P2M2_9AGAR|nr:hypothetical protein DFH07DRAFT_763656 [Mycena maculata]